jgi:dinuclear metal center YbgI/SA1388 family protein
LNGVSLADTLHALEQFAPPSLAESWDRSGLQVGDPQALVRRVLIALDPSAETIAEASRRKADLIVTHHPLFLKSPESLDLSRPANRVAASLIREGIALYSAHTSYDRAEGGVNDLLARKLGLEDVRPLGKGEGLRKVVVTVPAGHENAVRSAMAEAGGGRIGAYEACAFECRGVGTFVPLQGARPFLGRVGSVERVEEFRVEMLVTQSRVGAVCSALRRAHPYEEPAVDVYPVEGAAASGALGRIGRLTEPVTLADFADYAMERLGAPGVRYVGDGTKSIRNVALCGGSGADLWPVAASAGADVLLTGDVRYHAALDARAAGFCLVDAGHGATEAVALDGLAQAITSWSSARDAGIEVTVFQEGEPFCWLARA